jgi:hypothetical protein
MNAAKIVLVSNKNSSNTTKTKVNLQGNPCSTLAENNTFIAIPFLKITISFNNRHNSLKFNQNLKWAVD